MDSATPPLKSLYYPQTCKANKHEDRDVRQANAGDLVIRAGMQQPKYPDGDC